MSINSLLIRDVTDQLYLLSSEADRIKEELYLIDPCILDPSRKPLSHRGLIAIARHRLNLISKSTKSKARYYHQLKKRHLEIESIIKIQKAVRKKLKRNNEYSEAIKQDLKTILARFYLTDKEFEDTYKKIIRMSMRSNPPKLCVIRYKDNPITVRFVIDNHSNKERKIFLILDQIGEGSFKNAFSTKTIIYNWDNKRSHITDPTILKLHDNIDLRHRLCEVQRTVMHTFLRHQAISESPLVLINKEDLTVFTQTKFKCNLNDMVLDPNNKDLIFSLWICKGIRNIGEGLIYMHERHGLIHRDIKPTNVFITDNMEMKIGDMGTMTYLNHEIKTSGSSYFIPSKYLSTTKIIAQDSSMDAFALVLTLAFSVFKKNLFYFLPRNNKLCNDPRKLKKTLIESRRKFAEETSYENGKHIYSEKINKIYILIIKDVIIKKVSNHEFSKIPISDRSEKEKELEKKTKSEFITLIKKANNMYFIKNLIENCEYLNENLKKELLFDARFIELTLELLIDAVNRDLERFEKKPITVQEIVDRLNGLLAEFSL